MKKFILFFACLSLSPVHAQKQDSALSEAETATQDWRVIDPLMQSQWTGDVLQSIEVQGLDKKEEKNALAFVSLNGLLDRAMDQPEYNRYMFERGKKEIAQALQPFGYYTPEISYSIYQSAKGETDENGVTKNMLKIVYTVKRGEPVRVRDVSVIFAGEVLDDAKYLTELGSINLRPGDVLYHPDYESYKGNIQRLSAQYGYFAGAFREHVIYVDLEKALADISLHYDSGKRSSFGRTHFRLNRPALDEQLLRRYQTFMYGDGFDAEKVAQMQSHLMNSGYFAEVFVDTKIPEEGQPVDVDVDLNMAKRNHYAVGLGYSTDDGARIRFNYDRRWVNRYGHQFSSRLYFSERRANFDNIYRIPGRDPVNDQYYFKFGAEKSINDDYDTEKYYASGGYAFIKNRLSHDYSINYLDEDFKIGTDKAHVRLIYPQASWLYSSTDNLINPSDGYQLRLRLRGASGSLGSDLSLVQATVFGKFLKSLSDKQRLSFRGALGSTWTTDFHQLPTTLRFFAGGDRSVRGYNYESIGERDVNKEVLGGKNLWVSSAEYEYFFKPNWAWATFIDAGDAFQNHIDPKIGAGFGLHWISPVGPIKFDVAHGFNDDYGDTVRVHLIVGAEFDL